MTELELLTSRMHAMGAEVYLTRHASGEVSTVRLVGYAGVSSKNMRPSRAVKLFRELLGDPLLGTELPPTVFYPQTPQKQVANQPLTRRY